LAATGYLPKARLQGRRQLINPLFGQDSRFAPLATAIASGQTVGRDRHGVSQRRPTGPQHPASHRLPERIASGAGRHGRAPWRLRLQPSSTGLDRSNTRPQWP